MTVKAARILRESPVIAWFCRHDRPGHARQIAGDLLPPRPPPCALPTPSPPRSRSATRPIWCAWQPL
ncbi:hypothetical protein RAA17_03980 [Komagataeibacter rhaeticus]|nr:hypothetical protein [Komagataeibacter rhaeticus]